MKTLTLIAIMFITTIAKTFAVTDSIPTHEFNFLQAEVAKNSGLLKDVDLRINKTHVEWRTGLRLYIAGFSTALIGGFAYAIVKETGSRQNRITMPPKILIATSVVSGILFFTGSVFMITAPLQLGNKK